MQESLLTTKQLAERLGVSPSYLAKRRMERGGIPHVAIGRAVRYRIEDVEAWLDANRRMSTLDRIAE